jgi:hypothetical protein
MANQAQTAARIPSWNPQRLDAGGRARQGWRIDRRFRNNKMLAQLFWVFGMVLWLSISVDVFSRAVVYVRSLDVLAPATDKAMWCTRGFSTSHLEARVEDDHVRSDVAAWNLVPPNQETNSL